MKLYRALLKHDTGKAYIRVLADNLKDAAYRIMELERCPLRAILRIKPYKGK